MKITGVTFDEGSVQITYFDQEPNDKAALFHMVIVQNKVIQQHLDEMQENLEDILNDALIAVRNPPEAIN